MSILINEDLGINEELINVKMIWVKLVKDGINENEIGLKNKDMEIM